jgi:hypothetical protein
LSVPNCVDVFCHLYALGISYRCLTFLFQFIDGFSVFSKIQLCTYQDDGDIRSVMRNFREPLLLTLIAGKDTFVLTFSKEGGETREKQIKNISV